MSCDGLERGKAGHWSVCPEMDRTCPLATGADGAGEAETPETLSFWTGRESGAAVARILPLMASEDPTAAMFNFFRAAVAAIRPASATTLPSIAGSLQELDRAIEASTQRAVEQTELLSFHLGHLAEMLTRLERHVSDEPEGRAAWSDAVQACLAMPPAVNGIVRAMEYRDPAGQELRKVGESIEALR